MIVFSTVLIQLICFHEIITIATKLNKIPENFKYSKMVWYFVFTSNYFFAGKVVSNNLMLYAIKYQYLRTLVLYHSIISFCFYSSGLALSYTQLNRKKSKHTFDLLCWTHLTILIIVLPCYMAIQNLFEGMIWTILPLCLVIINDISSYVFGQQFGRTSLIQISPKKTWEGFLIGGTMTIVFGFVLAQFFSWFNQLSCPVQYQIDSGYTIRASTNCTPPSTFREQNYQIFYTGYTLNIKPLFLHTLVLSIFASTLAPFGGFFASGLKRAIGVKDFGDIVPGHGGLTDRFDCQFLMATFARIYFTTFVKESNVNYVFNNILILDDIKQLEFYKLFETSILQIP